MYRYLSLFLLAALASVADASRSSSLNSHARRSLALKQRDPQLGLGGILGGGGGVDSILGGLGTGLGLAPPPTSPVSSAPATSSVLPPTSTAPSASSSPSSPPPATTPTPTTTPCGGLLGLGIGCPAPTSSGSSSSCGGLLGLGIGCPAPQTTSTPPPATSNAPAPTSAPPGTTPPPPPPSPTSSCGGLLGLGIGCPPPPTSSGDTSSCGGLLGLGIGCPPPSSPTSTPPSSPSDSPSPSPTTTACSGLLGLGLGCPPPSSPTPSPTDNNSPAPTTSCGGLLGLGIGCPPPPTSTPSPTDSNSPTPTTSCAGLLGLGLGCSPPSTPTPTSSGAVTTSCGLLGSLLGCSSGLPTPTLSLSNITSALPTSTVISFPGNSTSMSQTVTANVTATPTYSATHTNAYTSNSNYNYLSTVSSLLLNTATPTAIPSMSNPDQAPTTLFVSAVATASPTLAPLPSGLPRVILPQPQLDVNTLPTSDSLINVLFNGSLNWEFVAGNADSPGQIFEFFPSVIATALNIAVGQVQNYELTVYEPTSYTGPQDIAMLGTIWQGYIPTDKVSMLASLISNQKSVFYTSQAGSIPSTLAACVDPSLDLEAISGPAPGGGSNGSSSSGSNVRQDAIIGVVSSLGAIALLVVGYVAYKAYKRRRDRAHRRLSDNIDYVGVRPDGQEFDRDSVGGQRRRSFYYAEDSLRGYQDARPEEDGYDHTVTPVVQRRPIRPGVISTPILRESTMNW